MRLANATIAFGICVAAIVLLELCGRGASAWLYLGAIISFCNIPEKDEDETP